MARRGGQFLLACRIAYIGNNSGVCNSRARDEDQSSTCRIADRGSGEVGLNPRDLKIKRIPQVCDLEVQQEIKRLQEQIHDLELQHERCKAETVLGTIMWDKSDEEVEGFVYDDYEDEECDSWMTNSSIVEDDRKSWDGEWVQWEDQLDLKPDVKYLQHSLHVFVDSLSPTTRIVIVAGIWCRCPIKVLKRLNNKTHKTRGRVFFEDGENDVGGNQRDDPDPE
ncbi:hypothetical protein R6Q57_000612 [Mikania cordata]